MKYMHWWKFVNRDIVRYSYCDEEESDRILKEHPHMTSLNGPVTKEKVSQEYIESLNPDSPWNLYIELSDN